MKTATKPPSTVWQPGTYLFITSRGFQTLTLDVACTARFERGLILREIEAPRQTMPATAKLNLHRELK